MAVVSQKSVSKETNRTLLERFLYPKDAEGLPKVPVRVGALIIVYTSLDWCNWRTLFMVYSAKH